jgi:hypothetical protein
MNEVGYKNLGCMNSWFSPKILRDGKWVPMYPNLKPPVEFQLCREAGHKPREITKGRCWYQVYCDICKITYDVDSSD